MFLGTECYVVDHHEIKEGIDELRSVGTIFISNLLNTGKKE
jgi:hypothetical protein